MTNLAGDGGLDPTFCYGLEKWGTIMSWGVCLYSYVILYAEEIHSLYTIRKARLLPS